MRTIYRRIRRVRDLAVQSLVRVAVATPWARTLLNTAYLRLTPRQRSAFHRRFSAIFRTNSSRASEGTWRIEFEGKNILMPLHAESMWLDWDSAVSITGHDIEIKEAYRFLLNHDRPDVFFDIGANYGTHSLLFLVHGIETMTFEPNSTCCSSFRDLCKINDLAPNLQHVALGESAGSVELAYPPRRTWLGSTDSNVANQLASHHELFREQVEQKRLDDYLPQMVGKSALLKIDTEGNELAVLRGSIEVLRQAKPKVIFECWKGDDRTALWNLFDLYGYQIHSLDVFPAISRQCLGYERFTDAKAHNFIAIPR